MKREEKKNKKSSIKVRIKRFAVFMLCMDLICSNISFVSVAAPEEEGADKGAVREIVSSGRLGTESAGNACRPDPDSVIKDDISVNDEGQDLTEGESRDEVEDQDKDEPKKGGDEEDDGGKRDEGSGEEDIDECDSVILPRTVSVEIFENDQYETLLSNGTRITLSGRMPEGVTAKAYPVEVSIEGIVVLASYDITVYDRDGDIWQPQDGSVEVTIDNKDIRDAIAGERDISVFHIDDNIGEIEKIELLSRSSRKARFSARHFSVYIVGDTSLTDIEGQETVKYIFNFYGYPSGENGGILSTQSATSDEYLYEPARENIPHHEFKGWFSERDGEGERFDFSKTVGANLKGYDTESEKGNVITVSLYADYGPVFYVYFMTEEDPDVSGEPSVFFTGVYRENEPHLETVDISDMYKDSYLKTDGKECYYALTGWYSYDENGEKVIITDGSVIDDDIVLYPEIQSAVWVYFNMAGAEASKVDAPAPVYVLPDDKCIGENFPKDPERAGYSFTGWHTKDGIPVDKDTDISAIEKKEGYILLFAGWETAKAGYTVNIWRQKAESTVDAKNENFKDYTKEYDIAETIYVTPDGANKNAALQTGSAVSAVYGLEEWSEWTGYAEDTETNSRYLGFEYNEQRTLSELGPEETVITGDGSTKINIYYDRVTITWNFYGMEYDEFSTRDESVEPDLILCGLWGADLKSGEWPSVDAYKTGCIWNYSDPGISYRFDTSYKYLYLTGSTVPLSDVDFYLKEVERAGILCVFKEVLEKDKAVRAVTSGGVTRYYEFYTYAVLGNDYRYGISEKFNTHHAAGYIDSADPGNGFVPADTHNGTVKPTIEIDADPEQTIELYYDLNSYDLTFYSNGEKVSRRTYLYSEPIEIPGEKEIMAATREDPGIRPASYYNFAGWGTADTSGVSTIEYETMPGKDLVYYAVWECKKIRITYDPGVSDGSVTEMPADEETSAASRAEKPEDPVREGYVFTGWKTNDGKFFNFSTVIYEDTNLTAAWRVEDPDGLTLTYVVCGYGDDGYFYLSTPPIFYPGTGGRIFTIEEVLEKAEDVSFADGEKEFISDSFISWNGSIDGSGRDHYPDSLYTFGDKDGVVYSKFAKEKKPVLHLRYNYPEGETSGISKEDIDITADNLEEIDLAAVSGLNEKDTITSGGEEYGFAGWSTKYYAHTEEEVEIRADQRISVNGQENTLYGVWVKLYQVYPAAEKDDSRTDIPVSFMYIGAGGGRYFTGSYNDIAGAEEQDEEITGEKEGGAEMSLKERSARPDPGKAPEEGLPYTGDPEFEADNYGGGSNGNGTGAYYGFIICLFIAGMYIMILLQILKLINIKCQII